jgi:hypothetical protein
MTQTGQNAGCHDEIAGKLATGRSKFPKWKMLTSVRWNLFTRSSICKGACCQGLSLLFARIRSTGLWHLSGGVIRLAKIGDLCRSLIEFERGSRREFAISEGVESVA